MPNAVRCPRCRTPVRVAEHDLGRVVVCPACGDSFATAVEPHPDHPVAAADALTPPLVGFALLPWGIPMLWVAALVLSRTEPIFSFALPVALAVGLSALGMGLGAAAGWGFGTKLKGLLAIALLGYAAAGGLYFVKREWAEAARQRVGRGPNGWRDFAPPDAPYTVRMPGRPLPTGSPLPGWELSTFAATEDEVGATDTFVVAHGKPPADLPADAGGWFARTRDALAAATGGEVRSEAEVGGPPGFAARQFVLALPDGTPRVVRLFRGPDAAFYLAAEGPFFTPDAKDVKAFFRSFRVTGRR